MKTLHIIEVKYHGPTNTKGSRVSIKSHRFGCKRTFDLDYSKSSALDQALDIVGDIYGLHRIIGYGESEKSAGFIMVDAFEPF